MSPQSYRPDIDGLRAIAVLAVVLYHFGIGPLPGGFVGVDMFFVISGYLITGIIHKEIGRGSFTFGGFYERRIRRIFPALFAMLGATLLVGAWLLLPSDFVRLGNSTVATLLFGSNILFWRQSGYFDTSSEYNPLLHTWSLAVEEQFYIGLPILLLLLHRILKGRGLKRALLACTIVSFALCLWLQPLRPTATFFLSPFRAWELLLGSMLAVGALPALRRPAARAAASWIALAVLLWSLWWIKAGPAFPGWQATIPVLATAVLLHAGAHGGSAVQRLLSMRPFVFIGLISYSLYLWHWPLLVFARYRNAMQPLDPEVTWILLALAIVLATASYRWVETPFRRRYSAEFRSPRRRLFAGAAAASLVIASAAATTRIDAGWQSRFTPEVVAMDAARDPEIPFVDCQGKLWPPAEARCVAGDRLSSRRVLLWGDSYALAWVPALDLLGKRHGFAVELALSSSCAPLVGIDVGSNQTCREFNSSVARQISTDQFEGLDAIVLVASWVPYLDPASGIPLNGSLNALTKADAFEAGLRKTVSVADVMGVKSIVVGPTPGAPGDVPYQIAAAKVFGLIPPPGKSVEVSKPYLDRFWNVATKQAPLVKFLAVDPLPWFDSDGEYQYQDEHGRLLYRDAGHLNLNGAAFVAREFPGEEIFGEQSGGSAAARPIL